VGRSRRVIRPRLTSVLGVILSWVLLPAAMLAVVAGLGLLVERATGRTLAGALVPVLGVAGFALGADLLTRTPFHAATPWVLAGVSVAGLFLLPGRLRTASRRSLLVPVAVGLLAYATFAAPVLFSGEATFAGYIELDDTSTWLAITDGLLEEGRDLDPLPDSAYEATLHETIERGYPAGALLPFAASARLVGIDAAWAIQPYLALLGGLLAALLTALLARSIEGEWTRGAVAYLSAQAGLLYAFSLWGGVKELFAALLAAAVVVAVGSLRHPSTWRAWIPAAMIVAAVISGLSFGGLTLLIPAFVVLLVAPGSGRAGAVHLLRRAKVPLAMVAAGLLAATLLRADLVPRGSLSLLGGDVLGNLTHKINPLQVSGVWPAGDLREDPMLPVLVYVAIAAAIGLWALGMAMARRDRDYELLAYGLLPCLGVGIFAFGSPWLGAKTLAICSPALLSLAGAGLVSIASGGTAVRRAVLAFGAAGIATGVVGTNLVAYSEVSLAPRERFEELELISDRIAGQGPALVAEYEPYATRHFLRDSAPEAPAELGGDLIPLRSGEPSAQSEPVDLDRLRFRALLGFPIIVKRVSPLSSRPPGPYELDFAGEYYEIWKRSPSATGEALPAHLQLTGRRGPYEAPSCPGLGEFLRAAGVDRAMPLSAAPARRLVIASATRNGSEGAVAIPRDVETEIEVGLPFAGAWEVWLGVTSRSELELSIDGESVGTLTAGAANPGQMLLVTRPDLAAGKHVVGIRNAASVFAPGSERRAVVSSLVLRPVEPQPAEAETSAAEACRQGRPLDWIEASAALVLRAETG